MRKTNANKEVLAFVLRNGVDKVDNLHLWDYTYDFESLKEDMPLTYARIEKDVNKAIKLLKRWGFYDEDKHNKNTLMEEKFEDIIREASLKLYEMVWG